MSTPVLLLEARDAIERAMTAIYRHALETETPVLGAMEASKHLGAAMTALEGAL